MIISPTSPSRISRPFSSKSEISMPVAGQPTGRRLSAKLSFQVKRCCVTLPVSDEEKEFSKILLSEKCLRQSAKSFAVAVSEPKRTSRASGKKSVASKVFTKLRNTDVDETQTVILFSSIHFLSPVAPFSARGNGKSAAPFSKAHHVVATPCPPLGEPSK